MVNVGNNIALNLSADLALLWSVIFEFLPLVFCNQYFFSKLTRIFEDSFFFVQSLPITQ